MQSLSTRRVVTIATVAALYVVLTIGLAPISFGPIQFRISEALKVLVLFDPWLVFGIGIGTFFANLFSPFAGPWELIWMPLTDMLGGWLAWALYRYVLRERWPAVPMAVYALTTGGAVGVMLYALGLGDLAVLAAGVVVSEMIVLILGVPVMFWIEKQLRARGFDLREGGR